MTTSPQSPEGLTVGGYQLLTRLGEGGMGVVHLARRGTGPRVALKVLRPHIVGDEEARQRLDREVNSLSRIRSRWVAEIVDADPWGDVPYVATRYVPGLSLHDQVHEDGPIDGDDLRWFAECLAEGLTSVHDVGVLHRDVKPSNVLMEGRTPILIDFGLARVADDPRLTHTGWLLGTPGYLAPEILYGDDATAASDVHSWAATVAYAGTGRPPFGRGPSMAIMDRVRRGQHDLTGLPEDVAELVEAALDPEPRHRPGLEELRAALVGGPVPVVAMPAPPAPRDDPYTVPLALATSGHEQTLSFFDDDEPDDEHDPTRVLGEEPASASRVGLPERLRRGLLLTGLGVATGAAVLAAPWLAVAVIAALVWVLRAGSLAGSAAGARRELRGSRWYDGPQLLVASPWHVVQAVPGALLLLLWSLGLALACGLVCYAVAASEPVTLFACGAVLGLALWLGPGGSRLSGPVNRVVHPLSRSVGPWLVAFVVVVGGAVGLAAAAEARGSDWGPSGSPFSLLP
ncbi:serine/threonine-protein kinase [Nocardioides euryhalodurans]|uniref:non-specific serine/threonine protein kinase n=1 Tax=Nocardioides euryhalodurans TaxID=2518370 RepID=A0A4P7GPI2_9ACTN|nr:serine/threonine-protein kinase [Nocardioides euryhalodurans]QBR94013.1 serine/threonine protein kinase [Nocardioides euryhalodurans]